jgi:O-antigen ligase
VISLTFQRQQQKSAQAMVVLYVAIIALLPFGRLSELPILLLSVWGAVRLIKNYPEIRRQPWFTPFTLVFLGFFALAVISSIDSYWPQKSWLVSLSLWRFYFLAVLLLSASNASYLIQKILLWVNVVMLFWVLDALLQALIGVDVFGFTSYPGRLTGIFAENVKLGPVLALFLPIVLLQMCQFNAWLRWMTVLMMLLVIILSGTRSAWLMAAFVLLMFWWHHVKGRRLVLLAKVMVLSTVCLVTLWYVSTDFQHRVIRSVQLFQGDVQAIDYALADRLPIWRTAINMYQAHPVNGVGARAFRKAYEEYAEVDDVWLAQEGPSLHAHHWLLELLAETGTIGLIIMLWLMVIYVRYIRVVFQNNHVWPMVVALMTAFLPVISVYSLFSSFWSICLWWLLIMSFMGAKYEQS